MDHQELLEDLANQLCLLEDPFSGEPFVGHVYKKGEVYDGPFLDQAPDLVVDFDRSMCSFSPLGYQDNVEKGVLFIPADRYFGGHKLDGMFILSGWPFQRVDGCSVSASIPDIPATISLMSPSSV